MAGSSGAPKNVPRLRRGAGGPPSPRERRGIFWRARSHLHVSGTACDGSRVVRAACISGSCLVSGGVVRACRVASRACSKRNVCEKKYSRQCRPKLSKMLSAAMVRKTVRASSGRAASEPCAHAPVHTLASASAHRPPTLAGVPAHTEPHPQHTSTSADCAIIVVHEQKLCDG